MLITGPGRDTNSEVALAPGALSDLNPANRSNWALWAAFSCDDQAAVTFCDYLQTLVEWHAIGENGALQTNRMQSQFFSLHMCGEIAIDPTGGYA